MADTTLSPTGLVQVEVGASRDTWGAKLNADKATINGWFDAGPALEVANGGTGGTTAASARTNLGLGTAAVKNTGASGDAVPLLNTGNTWSANQTIGGAASATYQFIMANAGYERGLFFRTTGDLNRWGIVANSVAESGANAGSNLEIVRYNDAGAYLGTAIGINRSNGTITLGVDLGVTEGGTGASDAATARANLGAEPQGEVYAFNTQAGSYTLVLADKGRFIGMNSAGASNLTIPPNSSAAFPVGTRIDVCQYNAGQVTLVPGNGVSLLSYNSNRKLQGAFAACCLVKTSTDIWVAMGQLVP